MHSDRGTYEGKSSKLASVGAFLRANAARTHVRTNTHTHMHTHAHAHAHTHARTCTHTCTFVCACLHRVGPGPCPPPDGPQSPAAAVTQVCYPFVECPLVGACMCSCSPAVHHMRQACSGSTCASHPALSHGAPASTGHVRSGCVAVPE